MRTETRPNLGRLFALVAGAPPARATIATARTLPPHSPRPRRRWREEALARFNRLRATSRTNGHEPLYLRTSQSAPDLSVSPSETSPHLSPASLRSCENAPKHSPPLLPAAWGSSTLDALPHHAPPPLDAERVLVSGTRGVVN